MTQQPVDNEVWTLGWRLLWSMKHSGKSRDEMAAELGVAPSTVSRWTHDDGKRPPNKILLARWAAVTGIRVEWLLGRAPDPFLPPAGEPQAGANQRPTAYKSHGSRRGTPKLAAKAA